MAGNNTSAAVVRRLLPAVLAVILLAGSGRAASADEDFGRFFTTPRQREHLDELRNSASSVVVNVREEELKIDNDVKDVEQRHNEIILKGVVYRSDGKNTAWVNDSNSYEGDVASDITKVDEQEIRPDGIEMKLPGDKKPVRLKVGEAYDSLDGKTNDIIPEDDIVK